MTVIDLLSSQMQDLFRWGLIIALMLTTANTSAVTGTTIPLAAGILFVAVLIPFTLTPGLAPVTTQVLVGLVANCVILAVVLALRGVYNRFRAG